MFEPRYKGGVLLNIDASSLEIHIAALVAKDPHMIQILLDGDDYHAMTARNMWGIPKDEPVPKDIRSRAKSASFGNTCATLNSNVYRLFLLNGQR